MDALRKRDRNRTRIRISAAAAAGLLATVMFSGPAGAKPAPDEWNCEQVTAGGDQLCLHLNQFIGWWTGFNAEYRRVADQGPPAENVEISWARTDSKKWKTCDATNVCWMVEPPTPNMPAQGVTTFPAQVAGWGGVVAVDAAADLPSFSCIAIQATLSSSYYVNPIRTDVVAVCRDN
ncbi:hypothetical protein H0264_37905 [Nocardia huaxiensis]|uniref:Peptidase inhibitor family I36 n=1 Tax=Nocardia huaxiensis TaxID=2755382 RepID=A0A7D6VC82_9NOCA|nr:hypothetical protein [Nocardia huaxiensis]QLY30802.1 hypothetical protein H0264_37905 [Nocardia huaxiensis]